MNAERDGVDFGKQSEDYAEYRPGFPSSFYDRLETFAPFSGSQVVDLATGPAIMALEIARRGANVIGVDISPEQLRMASERAQAEGLATHCRFLQATAEDTTLEAEAFDWITAGQCWHWFDASAALCEADRLLRPSGLLVIAHYSYLTSHSEVARLSEELVLRHNPSWTMAHSDGMYPNQVEEVLGAGFELMEQFCYHHDQVFSHEGWRGRMRTCNGVGSREVNETAVEAYDRDLKVLLREHFDDPITVPHRVWAVVARKKPPL